MQSTLPKTAKGKRTPATVYDGKIIADFLEDECNVQRMILRIMEGSAVFESDEQKTYINKIIRNGFHDVRYNNKNNHKFYKIITNKIKNDNEQHLLYSFIRDDPMFVSFQQNYKTLKKYKMEIIPITTVCKNDVKFDGHCFQYFLNEENITEFVCYLLECNTWVFPNCEQLFYEFEEFVHDHHNSSYVDGNLFKCFTKMVLNFERDIIQNYWNRCIYGENPYVFLHECLCEYQPYNDYATAFPERKERLVWLHEQVYGNFSQEDYEHKIRVILADEYLVKTVCKFM